MQLLRSRAALFSLVLPAAALPAIAAEAQQTGGEITLVPYVGYVMPGPMVTGPMGTSVALAHGPAYGAQVSIPLFQRISVYGNVSELRADVEAKAPFVSGVKVADGSVLRYDAGLQLTAPVNPASTIAVRPFFQVGLGGARYTVEAAGLSATSTNLEFNAGMGVDIPIGMNLGLTLMARDHIGRFDTQQGIGLDYEGAMSHNWALIGGLRLAF